MLITHSHIGSGASFVVVYGHILYHLLVLSEFLRQTYKYAVNYGH